MTTHMQKITDGMKAFELKLQALYDIEHELEKALPKFEKAATDPVLKEGFALHLKETEEHAKRLEKIFRMLGLDVKKTKSEGIRGIAADAAWVIKADAAPAIKDAMLASAARYAEHYEMAGYMSAIEQAKFLGQDEIADALADTLKEEHVADASLAMAMNDCLKMSEALGE